MSSQDFAQGCLKVLYSERSQEAERTQAKRDARRHHLLAIKHRTCTKQGPVATQAHHEVNVRYLQSPSVIHANFKVVVQLQLIFD
eukprot:CAMPEP_0178407904 /NCGR_PEP_ID=MMETSP0689_2-20121128/19666_1 /TAXON_ID=160604 /ORGANISM="Amphidinium massartii, Strain CS-259" /LENGTH=84 /DNA_ID=CAMNT_0020028987 /DNA_START=587 /DNA_END=841 /DNA_ORIENTATION=+